MKLRPTISLDEWKIATHLEASRRVQQHPDAPATGCECLCCRNWRLLANATLPEEIKQQLLRFGIEIERPSDAYAFEQDSEGAHCRIVYHAVGKILSGPVVVIEDPKFGRTVNYREVRAHPHLLSLAVLPSRQTFDQGPGLDDSSAGDLLQFDFRLYVKRHPSLPSQEPL